MNNFTKDLFIPLESGIPTLFKEIGFDEACFTSYDADGELNNLFNLNNLQQIIGNYNRTPEHYFCSNSSFKTKGMVAALTYEQAVDYLFKTHGYFICVFPLSATKFDFNVYSTKVTSFIIDPNSKFDSKNDAYIAGFNYVFNLIKHEKNA